MRRWLTLLTVLVMGLALTVPAFAQTVLFAPKQYTRTASPPNVPSVCPARVSKMMC
jgi:hypothetical protein